MDATGISLTDSVALITGASRGIGLAIARQFARAGASVMLTARIVDNLERAADGVSRAGGNAAWFAADVRDPSDALACVEATVARFGRVDVLVNNAGTSP